MKNPTNDESNGTKAQPARATPLANGRTLLRLVKSEVAPTEAGEPLPPAPRQKSNLARFFDAYADAIDRDVKAILDL